MKRILLLFFILFTVKAYSQKISYGISAGLNYTNLPGNGTLNHSSSDKYLIGFRVGGLMDIGYKTFSIQPGILFTTTGGQGKVYFINGNNNVTDYVNNKIVLNYIEIPINFLYRIKTSSGKLFVGGGPYVGIGISGKISYATNKSFGTTDNLSFGGDYSNIKMPDLGINVLEGYQLNSGIAISAGYSLGLRNIYNTGANNKNKGFNFSVDYFF